MDWSKAKTTMIVAFLLLDIVLGYKVWVQAHGNPLDSNAEEILAATAKRIIEQRFSISVKGELPQEKPQAKIIEVYPQASSHSFEAGTLAPQIIAKIAEAAQDPNQYQVLGNLLQEELKGELVDIAHYRLEAVKLVDKAYQLIFTQCLPYPIYGSSESITARTSYAQLLVGGEGELLRWDQSLLNVANESTWPWLDKLKLSSLFSDKQDEGILSAAEALLIYLGDPASSYALTEQSKESKLYIEQVELAYYDSYNTEETDLQIEKWELTPVWSLQISRHDGSLTRIYINAFTGKLEGTKDLEEETN